MRKLERINLRIVIHEKVLLQIQFSFDVKLIIEISLLLSPQVNRCLHVSLLSH